MYFVIYSKSAWLLARLSTDLMLEGVMKDSPIAGYAPLFEKADHKYLFVYRDGAFNIINHQGTDEAIRLWITEKNYIEMLSEIIQSKNA